MKIQHYRNFWASQVAQLIKNPPAKAGDKGDSGSILGSRRSPGVRNSNPLQYYSLGNPLTEEPGMLQSMGSQRVKECSNYHTIALISDASKVMLKILQVRLQQYVNQELPDVQAGFRRCRGTRNQIANIHQIIEKAREFQKNI